MNIKDLTLMTLVVDKPDGSRADASVAVLDFDSVLNHADIREYFSEELFRAVAAQLSAT